LVPQTRHQFPIPKDHAPTFITVTVGGKKVVSLAGEFNAGGEYELSDTCSNRKPTDRPTDALNAMKMKVIILLFSMCSYVKDTSTFSDTSHHMQADARSPRNKFHVPVECDHNARTGAHNLPSDTPGLPHIDGFITTGLH